MSLGHRAILSKCQTVESLLMRSVAGQSPILQRVQVLAKVGRHFGAGVLNDLIPLTTLWRVGEEPGEYGLRPKPETPKA